MPEDKITVDVFRYQPDGSGEPEFQSYQVPNHDHWVVLDALNWIKDNLDGTLTYRWSCRMGICGSCGMMVNGTPKLSCSAFLRDYGRGPIRVEPLENFPVERDLVTSLDSFMEKLHSVKPWFIDDEEPPEGEYLQTPGELAIYKQFSMCINCTLCYAACPQLQVEENFVGPAAIALAHRYNLDTRDRGNSERQEILGSEEGVWSCTFVGECTSVCPKNVDPAAAIQQAKVEAVKYWFKKLFTPLAGK